MSGDQAFRRVAVARASKKFPKLLQMLEHGDLHMTGASKLAKHLTVGNQETLLASARRKSKTEIERLIAAHFPKPAAKTSIRKRPHPL